VLGERLDAGSAGDLRQALLQALDRQQDVILSGDKVSQVSTPAVQVILAAARSLEGAGLSFSMQVPSPALSRAFADLGLAAEFQNWAPS